MKQRIFYMILGAALILIWAFAAAPASAAEFYLRAEPFDIVVTGPGEVFTETVTMWGYALDSGPAVDDGVLSSPGPRLTLPVGDSTLTIHLENNLPAGNPTSVVVPSLPYPGTVSRTGGGRIRALTDNEAAPAGTTDYTWTGVRPGTFIYHSGSHMQIQIQMGLYGAVTKDAGVDEIYSGVPYDQEALFFFSEIDPVLHTAVASGNYGVTVTSTIDYLPRYFLINGDPDAVFGVDADPGTNVLLRFVNGGLTTKAPFIQNGHMSLVAEDAWQKTYPSQRFAFDLAALKTMDALFTVPGVASPPDVLGDKSGNAAIKIADRRAYVSPVAAKEATGPTTGTGGSGGSGVSGGSGGSCFINSLN